MPVVEAFTLQNGSSAGVGTPFQASSARTLTFEITGTSTSRTINFELAGPSGVWQPVTAFNVNDPTKFGPSTTGGNNTAPESWTVDVPYGYKFRANLAAVAGGTVVIKGWAGV